MTEPGRCGQRCLDGPPQQIGRGAARRTLDSLGFAYHRLGDHDQAFASDGQAVALFRETANHYEEANTLENLGDARHETGDLAARVAWTEALQLLEPLDAVERADRVRANLDPPEISGTPHV